MPATPPEVRCPKCGAELRAGAKCPACLLDRGWLAPEREPKKIAGLSLPPAFGDYEFLEEIAHGGMGVVYKARQRSLNRIVAIKMVLAGRLARRNEFERFQAEAETVARLKHANIVSIHEVGEHEGQPYFSMDYVEGQSLAELANADPLPASRAAGYLKTIAEAVHYAHSQGVLHRDLKPSNILIDQYDQPHITDFGLAKRLDPGTLTAQSSLTLHNEILGSPNFMPPEQARGDHKAIAPRSDVYSLGAILYQLITGRPPFLSDTVTQTLRQVAEAEPVSPRRLNPNVPRDLETICLKCLAKEPRGRYGSAQELSLELERYLRNEPIVARPVSPGERVWRWCGRNRALAAASGAAVVLLLAISVGSPIALLRINRERQRAENNAKNAKSLADENMWNLYAARIKLADQALKEGNAPYTQQLLESLRPATGSADLRGFEWYYLWGQLHREVWSLPGLLWKGRSLAFSKDGRWLATAHERGEIRLSNPTNGAQVALLTGHTGLINQVTFAPSSTWLASAGEDATVRTWDLAKLKQAKELRLGTNSFAAIAVSPNGRFLIAGEGTRISSGNSPAERFTPQSRSGRVAIWDMENDASPRIVNAHSSGVLDLVFLPDRCRFVSCGIDRRVKLIDCETGETLGIRTNETGIPFGAVVLPTGQEIVLINWSPQLDSGEIVMLDAATLKQKRVLVPSAGKVLCLALSPDGSKIASAGADLMAHVWCTSTGLEETSFVGHYSPILAAAFTPDGMGLATAGSDTVKLWEANATCLHKSKSTENSLAVSFSPDGKLLACGGTDVEIRDARSGALLRSLTSHAHTNETVAFSPDGAILKAAERTGANAQCWNTTDWQPLTVSKSNPCFPELIAFSPDNKRYALCVGGETVEFRDTQTRELVDTLTNLTEPPTLLAYVHDGTFLTGARELVFWDLATKRIKKRLQGVSGDRRVAPDGRWLAACRKQGDVRLYDLPDLNLRAKLSGHRDLISDFAFSKDSQLLATASWDGTVKVWHTLSGKELLSFPSRAGVVWDVAFAPDNRGLAFACGENRPGAGEVVLLRGATSDSPETVPILTESARAWARQGRWPEAGTAFQKAIELTPKGPGPYQQLALIMAMEGDIPGYRQLCQKLQTSFATNGNDRAVERMAKTCLVLPGQDQDFGVINRWVDVANRANPGDSFVFDGLHVAGLAAFRQGNYEVALDRMRQVLTRSNMDPVFHVSALMVMAMSQHALHHPEEARQTLAAGLDLEQTSLPRIEDGDLGGSWNGWIVAHLLAQEARSQIPR